MTDHNERTWVGQLEIGAPPSLEPVGSTEQRNCQRARVLVRVHGDPVGYLDVPMPAGGLSAEETEEMAWDGFGVAVRDHLEQDGIPLSARCWPEALGTRMACRLAIERAWNRPISVVICTRDRPQMLRRCLRSIPRLRYADFEVIVVDNAPSDDATYTSFTEIVGQDTRFSYVREARPGLSHARNRGLKEAANSHVAFTDDDAVVDSWWLHGIARGFARSPSVACVTGIVPAAHLDNASQHYFDRRVVSWSRPLHHRMFALDGRGEATPLFPFDVGLLGTGANFAVHRDFVMKMGGFDAALGAGTHARGGEDLDLFARVVLAGRALAREPSAIVWHSHRSSSRELRQQMRDFGIGLGAYLTKQLVDPGARRSIIRHAPISAWRAFSLLNHFGTGPPGDRELFLAELRGLARSPFAYRRARRSALRLEHTS
jgi:GT2 family glycosyltransferase